MKPQYNNIARIYNIHRNSNCNRYRLKLVDTWSVRKVSDL